MEIYIESAVDDPEEDDPEVLDALNNHGQRDAASQTPYGDRFERIVQYASNVHVNAATYEAEVEFLEARYGIAHQDAHTIVDALTQFQACAAMKKLLDELEGL